MGYWFLFIVAWQTNIPWSQTNNIGSQFTWFDKHKYCASLPTTYTSQLTGVLVPARDSIEQVLKLTDNNGSYLSLFGLDTRRLATVLRYSWCLFCRFFSVYQNWQIKRMVADGGTNTWYSMHTLHSHSATHTCVYQKFYNFINVEVCVSYGDDGGVWLSRPAFSKLWRMCCVVQNGWKMRSLFGKSGFFRLFDEGSSRGDRSWGHLWVSLGPRREEEEGCDEMRGFYLIFQYFWCLVL